jgi:hypothetical protein
MYIFIATNIIIILLIALLNYSSYGDGKKTLMAKFFSFFIKKIQTIKSVWKKS